MNLEKRHGIRSITLHGQAARATVEETAEDTAKLHERLREFDADFIYNFEEAGLFYSQTQRHSAKYSLRKCFRSVLKSFC